MDERRRVPNPKKRDPFARQLLESPRPEREIAVTDGVDEAVEGALLAERRRVAAPPQDLPSEDRLPGAPPVVEEPHESVLPGVLEVGLQREAEVAGAEDRDALH